MIRSFALVGLAFLSACVAPETVAMSEPVAEIESLERASGGSLAVYLIDSEGQEYLSHRADERMAFCSSFKLALAGTLLESEIDRTASVSFSEADFPGYQPVAEQRLTGSSGRMTLDEALDAILLKSDNLAANMIIDALGGPAEVTRRWKANGDYVSRLDRRETALNENAPGDPQDTSSARAMALAVRYWLDLSNLPEPDRARLASLMHASDTGLDRVRAGLPDDWQAGDKSGTCRPPGDANQQVNDIGYFRTDDDRLLFFAVMLARPQGDLSQAKAIIADVGRLLARVSSNGDL